MTGRRDWCLHATRNGRALRPVRRPSHPPNVVSRDDRGHSVIQRRLGFAAGLAGRGPDMPNYGT